MIISAAARAPVTPATAPPAKSQIAFSHVTLDLGGKTIVEDVSLDVRQGEFLCIIGASQATLESHLHSTLAYVYPPGQGD